MTYMILHVYPLGETKPTKDGENQSKKRCFFTSPAAEYRWRPRSLETRSTRRFHPLQTSGLRTGGALREKMEGQVSVEGLYAEVIAEVGPQAYYMATMWNRLSTVTDPWHEEWPWWWPLGTRIGTMVTMATTRTTTTTRRIGLTLTFMAALAYVIYCWWGCRFFSTAGLPPHSPRLKGTANSYEIPNPSKSLLNIQCRSMSHKKVWRCWI